MYRYYFLLSICFLTITSQAQENSFDLLLSQSLRAKKFTMSYPNEKVYLHQDNCSYFLDETLWFKAYVVNGDSNRLTAASEILHIELLTPEGAIVRTQKHRLKNGVCHGYITLDSALYSGYFEIRAYTKAMLNFDSRNYFSRIFPLFEKPQNYNDYKDKLRILPRFRTTTYPYADLSKKSFRKKETKNKDRKYKVKFYPEGGNLVNNTLSKVAFQIKDYYGRNINTQCYLYDDSHSIIDSFSSIHLGMGYFRFTPLKKTRYYITISVDKTEQKYTLPKAYDSGYSICVDNLSDSTFLKLEINSNQKEDTLGVVVLSRGVASSMSIVVINPEQQKQQLTFKKSNLLEGVNQIVLYNKHGQELASRMFFIRNQGQTTSLKIKATRLNEKENIAPYQHQQLELKVRDNNNLGMKTNFSISIYDKNSHISTYNTDNIYTNLLLSSEVRGFIPNVDDYFSSENKNAQEHLDLLLQVQGWSRCKWEYLSGYRNLDLKYFWEKDLMFYGRKYRHKWEAKDIYEIRSGDPCLIRYIPTSNLSIDLKPDILIVPTSNDLSFYNNKRSYKADFFHYFSGYYVQFPWATPLYVSDSNKQCFINFTDFHNDINLYLYERNITDIVDTYNNEFASSLFISESEYRPTRRCYESLETEYIDEYTPTYDDDHINQQSLEMIEVNEKNIQCHHPSIHIDFYKRGFYSQHFIPFYIPILDPINNRYLNSIIGYKKTFPKKKKEYKSTALYDRYPIASFNSYFEYYRLPLGTITTIATIKADTNHSIVEEKVQYPMSIELLESHDFIKDTSRYTCFIDSTIIHIDLEKRKKTHLEFHNQKEYQIYNITNLDENPRITKKNHVPDYVIEHYYRIVKRKSIEHSRVSFYQAIKSIDSKREREHAYAEFETIRRIIPFQGLTPIEKEFYSPDYTHTQLPTPGDFRRTLYWNPNVETDSNGNVIIDFYNNSSCKDYIIDAQGITENGMIVISEE